MANGLLNALLGSDPSNTLASVGAGFSGRLPEFQAQQARTQLLQQEEQRTQLDARRKAMAADFQQAKRLLDEGKTDVALNMLEQRVQLLGQLGADSTETQDLVTRIRNGQIDSVKDDLGVVVNRGINTGLIEPPEKSLEQRRAEASATAEGTAQGKLAAANAARAAGLEPEVDVKSTIAFPNGTLIQSTSTGRRVIGPQGGIKKGKQAEAIIRAAQADKIKQEGRTAVARKAGEQVTQNLEIAQGMFEKSGVVRQTLSTIQRGIDAIDAGANTGPIDQFLPNIKRASVELNNVVNQLGLQLIAGADFGQLNAGELVLALSTAVPTALEPAALREWLVAKAAAQTKLLKELEDDALTLYEPGNTPATIINRRRNAQNLSFSPAAAQGATPGPAALPNQTGATAIPSGALPPTGVADTEARTRALLDRLLKRSQQ